MGPSIGAMIKKKAKSKTAAKKAAKKKKSAKSKAETNPAEVRKEISKMVEAEATKIAEAVIGEGKKGQLAPAKYLFEMANIFPAVQDGTQATEEEDCLAKMLLDRMKPPPAEKKDQDEEVETLESAKVENAETVVAEEGENGAGDPRVVCEASVE